MIAGIKGKVHKLEINILFIETSEFLYEVIIPFRTYEVFVNHQEVFVYIYHSITDKSQKLYGFHNLQEREFFKFLTSLNGIGEMTAIRVLSYFSADELYQIINSNNLKQLEKIPKVKGKTSQKIVFEIKQNLKKFQNFLSENPEPAMDKYSETNELTVAALVQLGFDEKSARRQVELIQKNNATTDTAQIIKEVLKL